MTLHKRRKVEDEKPSEVWSKWIVRMRPFNVTAWAFEWTSSLEVLVCEPCYTHLRKLLRNIWVGANPKYGGKCGNNWWKHRRFSIIGENVSWLPRKSTPIYGYIFMSSVSCLNKTSPLAIFPQLFHFKLKILLFSKSNPSDSSIPPSPSQL